MAKTKITICPYCGDTQPAGERCRACGGLFEALSRRATHNAMGPWFIRDPERPYQPGCSYETLVRMIERDQITKLTIIRGPTTKQFWTIARHVPGVAHLLGYCHQCDAQVDREDHGCHSCGTRFGAVIDRNYLGLPELRPLPWESHEHTAPETSALSAGAQSASAGREFDDQPTGGRLSSFATDEELLTADDVDDTAWGGGPAVGQPPAGRDSEDGSALQTAPQETAVAETTPEPSPTPQTTTLPVDDNQLRLARKRILRQQATTQRLWIVLSLSIALNVLLASFLVFASGSVTEPVDSPVDPPAAALTDQTQTPPATDADSDATTVDSDDVQATPGDAGNENVAEGMNNDDAVAVEPSPYEQLLAQAQELMAGARNEQRELADRIADYEMAIERLKDVQVNAPLSVRPKDIAEQIDQAERELERLRLREFFP